MTRADPGTAVKIGQPLGHQGKNLAMTRPTCSSALVTGA
ncbi:hypothetical protein FM106_26525 [Brachybacterium faecium]|nr:hypothetical protein FM106_26525 [Brachybacterium faecium]